MVNPEPVSRNGDAPETYDAAALDEIEQQIVAHEWRGNFAPITESVLRLIATCREAFRAGLDEGYTQGYDVGFDAGCRETEEGYRRLYGDPPEGE